MCGSYIQDVNSTVQNNYSSKRSSIEWTQNNCEFRKRHSKRGKKMERTRGKQDGEESV
jgi:hypothetical protein